MELLQTYSGFLHMLAHQRYMSNELRLQLAYYLQLQDKVEEAMKIFEKVEPCGIAYDYMDAYFQFNHENVDSAKVLTIVDKYLHHPILHFRKMFAKIKE